MKYGDLHGARRIEEPERHILRAGVRAPIVAMKPGNAGGAKGCRKMEPRCRDGMDRHRRQRLSTALSRLSPRTNRLPAGTVKSKRACEALLHFRGIALPQRRSIVGRKQDCECGQRHDGAVVLVLCVSPKTRAPHSLGDVDRPHLIQPRTCDAI
jgi:hypothetical protein